MGTSSHKNLLRTGHAKAKDIPMTLQREMTHFAAQVKGKLTRVFDHDQLEALGARSQDSNPWQTQVMALGVPLLDHISLEPV